MKSLTVLRGPAARTVYPLLLDMAAPAVSFFVLHFVFGAGPVLALSVGAAAAGLRTVVGCVRTRRLSAFPLMMMVTLVGSLVLTFVTGDARLVLAKSAVVPALGGVYGLVTTYFGRTVINDVVTPFITKGDPRLIAAWDAAWAEDPVFVRRFRLLNVLWGVGFVVAAVLRVVIVYTTPLSVAVVVSPLPTLAALISLALVSRVLGRPLLATMRARAAATARARRTGLLKAAPARAEAAAGG
ncbi:VC0807 family protein [Streptomyces sp. MspMP-M5]|uniref:VC0807 family protein n=1 Tax=unclassified Streptomyces TaxID=2593676 RepID=UPI000361529F|nr:VC0807 family protein [Streptomyces sp. MspMP-M5]